METNKYHVTKRPEYWVYHQMLQRCYNPKDRAYENYGGRGIRVSNAWRDSFDMFFSDMGPRPEGTSLERRDNNRWYCADNCVWATRAEQNRNHRRNRQITIDGRTMVAADWCTELGVPARTFYNRLKRGLTERQALGVDP